MRITIIMGFFLPMPPDAGGATEKSWYRLANEFSRLGHDVTIISRRWSGWPDHEIRDGVRYIRIDGYDHSNRLWRNLARDLVWSLRAFRNLPPADITISNAIFLPIWLGNLKGNTGKLVLMPGRLPKGQFRFYRNIDLLLTVSTVMKDAILRENGRLESYIDIVGYPIDWAALSNNPRQNLPRDSAQPITVGFVGRLHREKGIDILVKACELLRKRTDLPDWRIVLCGPTDVSLGGSGTTYATAVDQRLQRLFPKGSAKILPPAFQPERLNKMYQEIDVFCYPSIASHGETFGVAVAEAMAAGAVPIVSDLPCFRDFVRPGKNGFVFDHEGHNSASLLADCIAELIRDRDLRARLSENARASVQRFDFRLYATHLLDRFSKL